MPALPEGRLRRTTQTGSSHRTLVNPGLVRPPTLARAAQTRKGGSAGGSSQRVGHRRVSAGSAGFFWLVDWAAVTLAAELHGDGGSHVQPPVHPAQRPVRCQPVPGTEREAFINRVHAFCTSGVLRPDRQPRDRDVGACILGPGYRGILDRHDLKIRAELDAEVPLSAMRREMRGNRLPQGMGTRSCRSRHRSASKG